MLRSDLIPTIAKPLVFSVASDCADCFATLVPNRMGLLALPLALGIPTICTSFRTAQQNYLSITGLIKQAL